ncbi:oxidoreductase [Phenylobacterium montanum]|uniref:Oxidoreductase n=1 Tax=Phenylobacterium montanum TaxID=2823693 RepID=A0A975IVC5_9CAUL|nr:oxidoreductase [Caulobacter sp. S6]QUD88698.1 oxidoreductase [Caulobacter sp. S6]
MADDRIGVGLIGFGLAGRVFHAPLLAARPEFRLFAVSTSRREAVAAELPAAEIAVSPEALFADPRIDLIVIATPNDTHEPLATAALKAGKAVVVDKPFTLDLASARRLLDLARRKDRLLSVFQNRRWDSDFLTVREAIAEGAVGRVVHFESHFDRFRPKVRDRWREGGGPGSGVWFDLGPHLVDQALQLFGLPQDVTASLGALRDGAKADDWAHVVLDYPRRRVVLNASMLAAGGVPSFTIHGDQGSLVKQMPDAQEAQYVAGLRPGAPGWGQDPDPLQIWDAEGRRATRPALAGDHGLYYAAVAKALRGQAANPTPAHEVLGVMGVLEAAIRSAASGTTIAIETLLAPAERAWPPLTKELP